MTKNHLYNLLEQLVIEDKSLWRIQNNYHGDAGDCEKCQTFWKKIGELKESTVAELEGLVKEHMA